MFFLLAGVFTLGVFFGMLIIGLLNVARGQSDRDIAPN